MEVISGRAITHLSTGDNFDAPSSLQESLELLPLVTPELPAHDSTSNLSNTIELELLPSPELIAQDISFNTSNTIDVEPPTSPNISAQDPIINLSDTIDLESLSSPGTPIQTSNSDIPYRTNSEPLPPSEMNSIQDKNTDVTFPNLPGKRLRFEERMKLHSDPWLIRFFSIVLAKKSNIIVTTNGLTDYFEALEFANSRYMNSSWSQSLTGCRSRSVYCCAEDQPQKDKLQRNRDEIIREKCGIPWPHCQRA